MKTYIIKLITLISLTGVILASCNDFLEKEPPSYVVPEDYYKTEDQVQACANKFYQDILPTYPDGCNDNGTDNQVSYDADSKYAKGQWKVGLNNGNWSWSNIRNINYQLRSILSRYNTGEISGSDKNIRQYIGEIYFFRAYCYFDMLQKWGDLPIVTNVFDTDEAILIEANKRSPRNEVARFIINDLDSANLFMSDNFETRRTRISPSVADLFKSRVALFEGSWLSNFKDTPFVPNGQGWPGAAKDYNKNYQFPTGSLDQEAKYFLEVAVASAEKVAEKYKGELVTNTGSVPQELSDPENPYFSLFGNIDMTPYKEVLLWKEYNLSLGITNGVEVGINQGNYGIGLTRGYVENFLMEDGKPTYASHSGYIYDDTTIEKVRSNRDPRLFIFLKEPGQKNVFKNMDAAEGDHMVEIEPYPNILNNAKEKGYSTGYAIRKGGTFDRALCGNGKGYTAAISFRATEALLNYIEAKYLLSKSIGSGKILEYWKTIREKAGFKGNAINPDVTIAATDIVKEAKNDWAAYTGGNLLSDPILYNIRRERRSELLTEGLRWMDLKRWRSLDQLIVTSYQIEGIHLWGTSMEGWYSNLVSDGSSKANVSSPSLSEYTRPFQKNMTASNLFKDGFTWSLAQYLEPLPIKQFLLTSSDYQSIDKSPLYQNPYWPVTADQPAEK